MSMLKRLIYPLLIILLISNFLLAACGSAQKNSQIILATTTSTYDSGLLDAIIPTFEANTGYIVKIISVGTGKALEMGDQGNADLLLVHAPASEKVLVENGSAIERTLVMHNDFVIVGPPGDPASVKSALDISSALDLITSSGAAFVSRGDDSGTHKKELSLWKLTTAKPEGDLYLETGQGMGATLRIASEKNGYTLTDRGTYLSLRDTLDLEILFEGDNSLTNIYHVMVVNPDKFPNINAEGARALSAFLLSPETQAIIGTFGVDKYGQPLFFPDAGKTEADFGVK